MDSVKFTLEFASGYETEVEIDRETAMGSEYWVEITQHQNPYDAADEPVRVDGASIDGDGDWQYAVDAKLARELSINVDDLYH